MSKKIAIASGKGGVGKSMLTASWAYLTAGSSLLTVDADVDAPNFHLWCGKDLIWQGKEPVTLGRVARVDKDRCQGCEKCVDNCAFGAIEMIEGKAEINSFFCEGCGTCQLVCPHKAIELKEVVNGEMRSGLVSAPAGEFPLLDCQLKVGQKGSGKLVDNLFQKSAEHDYDLLLVDAPAGLGCPIIATLRSVDGVVLVTEPTLSARADLERILTLVDHFQLPFWLVINKQDINSQMTAQLEKKFTDCLLGKIDYSTTVFESLSNLQPPVIAEDKISSQIKSTWEKFLQVIE